MPNITIEAVSLSKEKKNELIEAMTKTASEVTKIPVSSFIVLIKEFPRENWGIGGKSLVKIMEQVKQNS